jgi:hypothetical protein
MRPVRNALLLCAIVGQALAEDAPPSPETLLRKAIELQKAQDAKGWRFTFREDEEKFSKDKNGNAEPARRRTYENIMLEGDLYRKLVQIDGQPPSPKMQKEIEAEMEHERAYRRTHHGTRAHEVRAGTLEQIARMCDSKTVGEEEVSGRKAWRVESLPRPDYKPADKDEEKFFGARRVTWFDEQTGAAIKYLEVFIRPTAGFQPGSEIERTFGLHSDAWLEDSLILRYDVKMMAVVRGRGEARYRYYDYKKFEVESKITIQ